MNTNLAKLWEIFDRNVIAKDAPYIQRKEMQLAFYGGIYSYMGLEKETADRTDITEEQMLVMFDEWKQECEVFFKNKTSQH